MGGRRINFAINSYNMNKELPIVNRLIHKRELERANDLLMTRIMRIKVKMC